MIVMIKKLIGPSLFIICSLIALIWLLSSFPRVLILHSYSPTYLWTAGIDQYLKIGLRKRQYIKYKFYYMDSKRYYTEQIEKTSLRAIKNYNPDLIIAFDDNAQKLLSKYMSQLPEDVKIIFSGVNGYVKKYNYNGKENITGIFERKPVLGVIFALSQFNAINNTPEHKSLFMLTDSNNSSLIDIEILRQADWGEFSFEAKNVTTFEEWKDFILSIDPQQINYLLVAGYRKLKGSVTREGKNIYVNNTDVARWTRNNSPVPVIALNTFSAQDGFAFAIGSSQAEQANQPLLMMDKILKENIKPIDIPFQYGKYYSVAINKTAAQAWDYEIPMHFQSFASSVNTIYE